MVKKIEDCKLCWQKFFIVPCGKTLEDIRLIAFEIDNCPLEDVTEAQE